MIRQGRHHVTAEAVAENLWSMNASSIAVIPSNPFPSLAAHTRVQWSLSSMSAPQLLAAAAGANLNAVAL
jgi:hypothetical protein